MRWKMISASINNDLIVACGGINFLGDPKTDCWKLDFTFSKPRWTSMQSLSGETGKYSREDFDELFSFSSERRRGLGSRAGQAVRDGRQPGHSVRLHRQHGGLRPGRGPVDGGGEPHHHPGLALRCWGRRGEHHRDGRLRSPGAGPAAQHRLRPLDQAGRPAASPGPARLRSRHPPGPERSDGGGGR